MKTKVVIIISLLMITGAGLQAQKPVFGLVPSGQHQRIPESIVDMTYYNDSSLTQPLAEMDSSENAKKDSSGGSIRIEDDSSSYSGTKRLLHVVIMYRSHLNPLHLLKGLSLLQKGTRF